MSQSERFLDLKGLEVDYMTLDGPFRAVKGVDLHINRGEVLGLAGESGVRKIYDCLCLDAVAPPTCIYFRRVHHHRW